MGWTVDSTAGCILRIEATYIRHSLKMLGSICVCPVSQLRGKLGSEEEPAQTVMNLIFKSSCCF